MKNIVKVLGSVSAICLFAAGSPASAVTMQAVYTGFVSNSTDLTNMFGLGFGAGTLDGQSYILTFTYNPSRLGVVHNNNATSNVARGGPFDIPGSTSPLYFAELAINGIIKTISANAAGYVGNFNPLSNYNSAFHSALYQSYSPVFTYENYVSSGIGNTDLVIPLNLEKPYHVTVDGLTSNGQFDFNVFDDILGDYSVHTFGSFTATELTVSTVPLPAALPL